MFRKLALRLSAERHPGRVGRSLFGDSFCWLIASVHVYAMLCAPASTLIGSPTPMHIHVSLRSLIRCLPLDCTSDEMELFT